MFAEKEEKLYDLRKFANFDVAAFDEVVDYFYGDYLPRLREYASDECEEIAAFVSEIEKWRRSEPRLWRFERRSYAIFGDTYRHSYVRIGNCLELHPGLAQRVTYNGYYLVSQSRQRSDRVDGVALLCTNCACVELARINVFSRYFNLTVNNCDTITGSGQQTIFTWFFVGLTFELAFVDEFLFLCALVLFITLLAAVKLRNNEDLAISPFRYFAKYDVTKCAHVPQNVHG